MPRRLANAAVTFAVEGLPWLALFLIVVGARLLLVQHFGSDVPILDQWDIEGAFLLKPWAGGSFHLADLFAAHNEHRLVVSRLWTLLFFKLDGQWDPLLEIVANALLFGGIAVAIAGASWRTLRQSNPLLAVAGVALWGALPYAQENTLWGCQSSFYFLIFFSIAAIWALLILPDTWLRSWLGIVVTLTACFTMGSGFFAGLVVLAVLALRLATRRSTPAAVVAPLAIAAGSVLFGWLLRVPSVPQHAQFGAPSASIWLAFFGRCLAWPFCDKPALALLMYLPILILGLAYLKSAKATPSGNNFPRRCELLLAIVGWVILQAAGMSYARAGHDSHVVSRYMDILAVGTLANLFALVMLLGRPSFSRPGRIGMLVASAGWTGLVILGAGSISEDQMHSQTGRQNWLQNSEMAMRAYLGSHDSAVLSASSEGSVPYPDPKRIAFLLNDDTIRKILPPGIRSPLVLEPKGPAGFALNALPPEFANTSGERVWGSYRESGAHSTGSIETKPITPGLGYLQFEIAGYLRRGLSLEIREGDTGRRYRIIPTEPVDDRWRAAYRSVGHRPYSVVADDESTDEWFAFREPREMGRFSYYARALTRKAGPILVTGLLLFITACLQRAANGIMKRAKT